MEELTVDFLLQYALSTDFSLPPLTLEYAINSAPNGFGWAEWPALAVYEVYLIFLHTGDLTLFAEHYDALLPFTLSPLIDDATGLWTCPPNSTALDCNNPEVDWPPTARDGFVFTPTNTVVNAIAAAAMDAFAAMALALGGHEGDAAALAARAAAVRAAVNAASWDPATGVYFDGVTTRHAAWHSTVFALGFGVPTAATAPAVAAALVRRLPSGDANVTSCFPSSVWPTQWALEGLFSVADDHGRRALGALTCAEENGWLGLLAQGATQTPEAWSPAVKGNLEWGMTWSAAPGNAVPRHVLGVQPAAPGFARVRVRPQPGPLTLVAGVVPTLRGAVGVRFAQTLDGGGGGGGGGGGAVTAARLELALPGNTPATACLPAAACAAGVRVDGKPAAATSDGDYACVDLVAAGAAPRVVTCGGG